MARQRGREPVTRADARRLPIRSDSVDTVVSSMGLMLIMPLAEALHEIARVLRPGGAVAALVPARWPVRPRDVRPLFALAVSLHGLGILPQHLTARLATKQLRQAGLEVTDTQQRRFAFPIRSADDAAMAVHALYTLGYPAHRIEAAVDKPTRMAGSTELPLPLLRIVARSSG